MRKIPSAINYCILGYSVLLAAGSFLFASKEFAIGVVVGILIALGNFFLLKRVFGKIFAGEQSNPLWLLVYIFKLGLTLSIIFVSYKFFGADLYGLAVGLSPVVVGILIFTIFQTII